MDVFFWAIAPRVVFWTRFEANFRLGGNRRPLFLNGLTSPRVPGQLRYINYWRDGIDTHCGPRYKLSFAECFSTALWHSGNCPGSPFAGVNSTCTGRKT